jgi:hypothetical protein
VSTNIQRNTKPSTEVLKQQSIPSQVIPQNTTNRLNISQSSTCTKKQILKTLKLEFQLSDEKSLVLTVSRDTDPLKLATHIVEQVALEAKANGGTFDKLQEGRSVHCLCLLCYR